MWKELILIQGWKRVRAKKKTEKKEVGGETKTAIQPDATVELQPKTLQSDRAAGGGGRGRRASGVLGEGNLLFV